MPVNRYQYYVKKASLPIKNKIMSKHTIIVTGASSGIGEAIAKYFLDAGDNVIINSATPEKLEQAYQKLGGGANLARVAGDVKDKKTGEQLLAVALEKFGKV